jgi:hypothetical protein
LGVQSHQLHRGLSFALSKAEIVWPALLRDAGRTVYCS